MKESLNSHDPLESLGAHLSEGEKPIVACIGIESEHEESLPQDMSVIWQNGKPENAVNVDYYDSVSEKMAKGMVSGGRYEYVISGIDARDKYSSDLYSCLGLVVVGRDIGTGKDVSLMLHAPLYKKDELEAESGQVQAYAEDLDLVIGEMKEQCEPGSIDAVLFGGSVSALNYDEDAELYHQSAEFIDRHVASVLGFKPVHVGGPKTPMIDSLHLDESVAGRGDIAYFDTDERKFYAIRPDYMEGTQQLPKQGK